jgi:hypothetical protein
MISAPIRASHSFCNAPAFPSESLLCVLRGPQFLWLTCQADYPLRASVIHSK